MGTAVLAALGSGVTPLAVLGAAIAASGLFLLLRGWVVGTYVTDADLIIETTFRRKALPWSEIRIVQAARESCPLIGLPLRVSAVRVTAIGMSGVRHPTHVYGTSPDYLFRPEALDMAVLRLERWSQDNST